MRPLLTALVVALPLLAGCHDPLVDPGTDPIGNPPPASPSLRPMYLKGPEVMVPEEVAQFRGEPIEGARYSVAISNDQVATITEDGGDRVFTVRARRLGTFTLTMTAIVEGRPFASRTRTVEVRQTAPARQPEPRERAAG